MERIRQLIEEHNIDSNELCNYYDNEQANLEYLRTQVKEEGIVELIKRYVGSMPEQSPNFRTNMIYKRFYAYDKVNYSFWYVGINDLNFPKINLNITGFPIRIEMLNGSNNNVFSGLDLDKPGINDVRRVFNKYGLFTAHSKCVYPMTVNQFTKNVQDVKDEKSSLVIYTFPEKSEYAYVFE